jgi:hypothetical protein
MLRARTIDTSYKAPPPSSQNSALAGQPLSCPVTTIPQSANDGKAEKKYQQHTTSHKTSASPCKSHEYDGKQLR